MICVWLMNVTVDAVFNWHHQLSIFTLRKLFPKPKAVTLLVLIFNVVNFKNSCWMELVTETNSFGIPITPVWSFHLDCERYGVNYWVVVIIKEPSPIIYNLSFQRSFLRIKICLLDDTDMGALPLHVLTILLILLLHLIVLSVSHCASNKLNC